MENHPGWADANMAINQTYIRTMQNNCQRDFRGLSLKIVEESLEDGPHQGYGS
jgi:hypothetical protein